jgi:hypothetical protein
MQTFLPYEDIEESLSVLDFQRLGKQRVEAFQLLKIINGSTKAWSHHPATLMWLNYSDFLTLYYNLSLDIFAKHGGNNIKLQLLPCKKYSAKPYWLGNKEFHDSHKSNLLRKKPEYYSQFNWDVPDNLPYVWPTSEPIL